MVSKNLPLAFITAALALMIPRVEKEVSPIMARVQPGTFKQSNSTTQNSSSSSVNDDLRRAGIGIAGTIAGAIVVALSGWLCKQAYRKLRNNQGKRSAGSNGTGLSGGPNGGAPADLVRNETGMQPTTSPLGTLPTGQELRTNARHTGLPSDVPQLPPLAFGDAHRVNQEWLRPLPLARLPSHAIADPAG
ncbi:hypothetical protein BFJ70_g16642 [Fusarium oxysporum]|nr:hypothetical protein BFJ70_g16642 [Fusarium oxysporum]